MKLYAVVTADEYELPMFISESCDEIAKYLGLSKTTIFTMITKKKNGKRSGRKVIKFEV